MDEVEHRCTQERNKKIEVSDGNLRRRDGSDERREGRTIAKLELRVKRRWYADAHMAFVVNREIINRHTQRSGDRMKTCSNSPPECVKETTDAAIYAWAEEERNRLLGQEPTEEGGGREWKSDNNCKKNRRRGATPRFTGQRRTGVALNLK